MAITWFRGVDTNMMPSLTTGGASWPLVSPVPNVQTGRNRLTLSVVIWSSGLYPQPSYVRRIISQSPSSGLARRSAVTGR